MASIENQIILHISDLHFSTKFDEATKASRNLLLKSLIDELSSIDTNWHPTLVCITGDIIDKADFNGFEVAAEWLKCLSKALKIPFDNFIICPGNHDCVRDVQICPPMCPETKEEADKILTIPIPDYLKNRFKSYSSFCKKLGIIPYEIGDKKSYLIGSREISGIQFVVCNTAWFSFEENEDSKLWLGLNLLKLLESKGQLVSSDCLSTEKLSIALMHHGTETYFHKQEKQVYVDHPSTLAYLWKRCHLALYGHSHEKAIGDPDKMQAHCWRVRAGATNAGECHPNNVNLIKLEKQGFQLKYITYDPAETSHLWNINNPPKFFSWVDSQVDSQQVPDNNGDITEKHVEKNISILCEKAIAYSQDIIESKSRQIKPFGNLPQQIFLEVAVKSECEKITNQLDLSGGNKRENILYTSIENVIFNSRCTLLFGDLGTGKSTMLAKLALYIKKNISKCVPLFIPARCFSIDTDDNISEIIDSIYNFIKHSLVLESVYTFEEIFGAGYNVILLIDGLDEMDKTSAIKLTRILTKIPSYYSNIYVVLSSRFAEMIGIRYDRWQICQIPSLSNQQKQDLLINESLSQGYNDREALQFARKVIKKLQDNPLLNSIANSPLAVRLLCDSFANNTSGIKSKTLGDLLYELLLQRLGKWTELDLKNSTLEAFETMFPTPELRATLLGKLAFIIISNGELSNLEVVEAIKPYLCRYQECEVALIAKQAIRFFYNNGLITSDEPIRFIYQPLAQIAAGVYLANEIMNNRKKITEVKLDFWRSVSFAGTMIRRQCKVECYRNWFCDYIKLLLKTKRGILPACYICAEMCDKVTAKKIVKELPNVGRRPLWYREEERGASVLAIAHTLILAEDDGFNWLFKEYLDPKTPMINDGSALIQDLFKKWAFLFKTNINEDQKKQISKMIGPLCTVQPLGTFGFLESIVYLVPEAFELKQFLWLCAGMIDSDVFGQWAKKQLIEYSYGKEKEVVNAILERRNSTEAALLWLEFNQDLKPTELIVKKILSANNNISVYDQKIEKAIRECKNRIGENEWIYLLRWFLSDPDSEVSASAALKLIEAGENSLYLLGNALNRGLINKPIGCKSEIALRSLVVKARNTKINWSSFLFDNTYDSTGASAGSWRIFLDNLLSGVEDGPELLVNCILHLGPYNIPRYPDIRLKFHNLMIGEDGEQYKKALKNALSCYDADVRRAAAIILTACSPDDDGTALSTAISFIGLRSNYYYLEWEKFLLTLNYGVSALETLKESLLIFTDQQRLIALAILQCNGIKLEMNRKKELVKGECSWHSYYINSVNLGECNLNSAFAYTYLNEELNEKSILECSEIAESLLRYHADKLTISQKVKCYVACCQDSIISIRVLINNILENKEFTDSFKMLYKNTPTQDFPKLLRSFFDIDGNINVKWDEILWNIFCSDELKGLYNEDTIGLELLWLGEERPEIGKIIGKSAAEFLKDERIQKYRWVNKYHWLAVLADQFIGLDKIKLKEIICVNSNLYGAATYSLIYRLGKVPDELVIKDHYNVVPKDLLTCKKVFPPEKISSELINASRDSERLKYGISDLITATIFSKVQISQEFLDKLSTIGKNGCLLAAVLSYCYGLDIKADYALVCNNLYYSDEQRKSLDFQRLKKISTFSHAVLMCLDENAKAKYVQDLLNMLNRDQCHKNYYIYELFRVQKEQLPLKQFCYLLLIFVSNENGGGLDREIVYFISRWINCLIDESLKKDILSVVSDCINSLDKLPWNGKSIIQRDASVFLCFPLIYWYISDEQDQISYRVFAHGIKLLFRHDNVHERQKEFKQYKIIYSVENLIKVVPTKRLRDVFLKLSKFPDDEVRSWIKFFKCFTFED